MQTTQRYNLKNYADVIHFAMDDATKKRLKTRLEHIWDPPNLFSFFDEHAKRPSRLAKKGTVLFNEGDPLTGIYFLKKGFIKLYRMSPEGRETVIYLTGPGNVLGLRALTSENECAHHYTQALTDCEIITMTREDYLEVLSSHPEHLIDLMHGFIERLNHAERRLQGFISTDTTARVANFLYDIATRFTNASEESLEVIMPLSLTHQRIAEFVGAFRETVSVSLKKLEKDGIISMKRGNVVISDFQKLKSYVNPEEY